MDNCVEKYVEKLWTKCGKLFLKIMKISYPHLIHTLSTGYPHTYPHYYIGFIFFLIISTVLASASSYLKSSAIFSIPWLIVE